MGVRASVFVGALTAAAIVPAVAAAQAPSAAPSAVALPEPTASGDAALADKARAIFVMAQSGKIDRAQFDSGWNKISDAHVAKVGVWAASLGAVQNIALEKTAEMRGQQLHLYRVHCEKGDAEEIVSWDPDGKINTAILRPPKG